jgi:DNA-binding MarR family transcriptional regulator
MGTEFNNGFFIFDKNWFQDNKFFDSLTHAEFRIIVYLLSSTLRPRANSTRFKNFQWIVDLYHINNILFVNVSQRTIVHRCKVHRSTVISALKKFEEMGAVIIIPSDGNRSNNIYIVGFKGHTESDKNEYFLVDSVPLRSGKKLPDQIKNFITEKFHIVLFNRSDLIWVDLFGIKSHAEIEVVAG